MICNIEERKAAFALCNGYVALNSSRSCLYLPRQCGIATFTTDLCEAIATEYSETTCIAMPVNHLEDGYAYPLRVRFELKEKDIDSYRRVADFLNINNVDLACLQFEYGIFGVAAWHSHSGTFTGIAHAHRHDSAHHSARA